MRNIFFALFGLFLFALFGLTSAHARPSKAALCLEGQSTIIHLVKERLDAPEVVSDEALERLVRKHNRHCEKLNLGELELFAAQQLTERKEKELKALKHSFQSATKEPKAEPKAFRAVLAESCDYTMSFSISANNAEIERLKGVARQRHAKGKSPLACVISLNKAMAHQARLILNLAKRR